MPGVSLMGLWVRDTEDVESVVRGTKMVPRPWMGGFLQREEHGRESSEEGDWGNAEARGSGKGMQSEQEHLGTGKAGESQRGLTRRELRWSSARDMRFLEATSSRKRKPEVAAGSGTQCRSPTELSGRWPRHPLGEAEEAVSAELIPAPGAPMGTARGRGLSACQQSGFLGKSEQTGGGRSTPVSVLALSSVVLQSPRLCTCATGPMQPAGTGASEEKRACVSMSMPNTEAGTQGPSERGDKEQEGNSGRERARVITVGRVCAWQESILVRSPASQMIPEHYYGITAEHCCVWPKDKKKGMKERKKKRK